MGAHGFFLLLSHFEPLPFRRMSLWSQGIYPSLPRYMPCILISRIGSALPHRVSSHQTQSTTLFTHVLTLSTVEIIHYEEKPNASGIEPQTSTPMAKLRTIRPPGLVHPKWLCFRDQWFLVRCAWFHGYCDPRRWCALRLVHPALQLFM